MDIIIIGTGNVATVVGRKILSAGHHIIQVFSRTAANAQGLATRLQAEPISHLDKMHRAADLIILAIPDSVYGSFVPQMPGVKSLVLHTAGAVPMQVLAGSSSRYGVLYPLQSLRKELNPIPEFPLLIDANQAESLDELRGFAAGLSETVRQADDQTRLQYHLGAVFVGNFTNHLFALTEDWCKKEGIAFSLLQPLIHETINRLGWISPAAAQTGPALRNDLFTLDKHSRLLEKYPELSALYAVLTESIRQFHQK